MNDKIRAQLRSLIRQYCSSPEWSRPQQGKPIPLMVPTFGAEEISDALDCMLETRVTMGEKVKRFEALFAEYIGVRHAVMVNSGSSANLLALSVLTNPLFPTRMEPGDEVITPAVTWATTVWPIINCGAIPVLVNVDLDTFDINVEAIQKAITSRTRALMIVHLLGNPCEMDPIRDIAREHKLWLIEDSCEAHGAEFGGRKVGSFGDISTFSFFFSHHITTMEGGMVLTDSDRIAETARALRTFGWIRDLRDKDELSAKYRQIDWRFLFTNIGFNLRPLEVEAAFGIRQIEKLDSFITIRRNNAKFWEEKLGRYQKHLLLHTERAGTKHVWFGYPITVRPGAPFGREEITSFLEAKGVETRPIMAGNINEQPAMQAFPHRTSGELVNSRTVMRNSFFIGNHQGIGKDERESVVSYITEFMSKF